MKHVTEALRALKHPGQTAVIGGAHVKREALRYVVDGQHAYCIEDAAQMILQANPTTRRTNR